MQQQQPTTAPPSAAPAPAPPPAGPAGAATIVTGGATIPLQGAPNTPQEIQGLRERREILRDQLERATNRREEIVSELNATGNPDARTGLQERLALLDGRILQLERDQAATEQLISNAAPEVLALAAPPSPLPGGADDADMLAMGMFAFTFGVLLTWFVGRVRRRRRKGSRGAIVLPDDPRLERLNQAVEAIAEEVERIGEGQRFVTQLLAERSKTPALPKKEN